MSDDDAAAGSAATDGDDVRPEDDRVRQEDDDRVRHEEILHAHGHEHVAGTHASTFEVTTDDYLTPAGDCIVGIEADRSPAAFDDAFVAACRDREARIETTLSIAGTGESGTGDGASEDGRNPVQRVVGRGDPELSFENERSAVWRTSEYVDDRTIAVGCDHAAADLDRGLVGALADGAALEVRIAVTVPA